MFTVFDTSFGSTAAFLFVQSHICVPKVALSAGVPIHTVSHVTGNPQQSEQEAQNQKIFAQLQTWIENDDTVQIHGLLADLMIELDDETERMLTRNLSVPECTCEKPAKAVIDKVTGCIFFICRDCNCYFVEQSEEEAAIG